MESLKMSDKLTTALQKLAISSVKADRLAIERLEKQYGASLLEIINELEDYAIVHQSISDERAKPRNQLIIVCCYGCLWGAVIGIATLFIKPSITVAAIGLGFTPDFSPHLSKPCVGEQGSRGEMKMKRSQKSEFRSQNTPCLQSGVSSKEYFFSPPRLKSGALDHDSSTFSFRIQF
jgi:hypothetical protein